MTDTKSEATQEVAARDTTFDGIIPKTAWISHRTSPDRKYIVWYLDINGIEKEMGRFYVHSYDGILSHSQNLPMLIQPLQAQLDSFSAKHERVLQALEIATKALKQIAGPRKKDGSYFYSIPEIQQMGDDGADADNARYALEKIDKIESLK